MCKPESKRLWGFLTGNNRDTKHHTKKTPPQTHGDCRAGCITYRVRVILSSASYWPVPAIGLAAQSNIHAIPEASSCNDTVAENK